MGKKKLVRKIRQLQEDKSEFKKLSSQKKSMLEFFLEAPLPEIEIDMERNRDRGRDVDL